MQDSPLSIISLSIMCYIISYSWRSIIELLSEWAKTLYAFSRKNHWSSWVQTYMYEKLTKTRNVLLWSFIMGVCQKKRSTTTYKLTKFNFNTFSVLPWQKQPLYLVFCCCWLSQDAGKVSPAVIHQETFLTGDNYRWCIYLLNARQQFWPRVLKVKVH